MSQVDAIRTLRFTAGSTAAVAFAFGLDYSLAMLTPVFAATFLGAPSPRPTLRVMTGILVAALIGLSLGVVVSLLLSHAPSVLFLTVGILLFHIFLAAARGTSAFLVLMLLLGVLLVPVVGLGAPRKALGFAVDFMGALAVSLVFVQLAFELFPDPRLEGAQQAKQPPSPPAWAQLAYAAQRTAIFLPLFATVVSLQWVSQLQALLYAVILSLGATPAVGWKASLPMLGGAAIGGAMAIVIYVITSMFYEFPLFLALVAFFLLVIGRRQFSDAPSAVYFASAKGAMLILIASSSSLFGDETGAKFVDRLTSILTAAAILAAGSPVAAYLFRVRGTSAPARAN